MRLVLTSILIFVFCLSVNGQTKDEYLILRVSHYTKKHGLDSRLTVDLGTNENHSLKNIIENSQLGSVKISRSDGTVNVLKNEVDFLNIMSDFGFSMKESYVVEISGIKYTQYIFVKSK